MKPYHLIAFIPVVLACTKESKNVSQSTTNLGVSSAKVAAVSGKEWRHVAGVISQEEKCSMDAVESNCLKIIGGDDLNGSETFFLEQAKNGYEVIEKEGDKPKKFRIWLNDKSEAVEVAVNETVNLYGEVKKNGSLPGTVTHLESVAFLDK